MQNQTTYAHGLCSGRPRIFDIFGGLKGAIIGSWEEGGFKFLDLDSFLKCIKLKFLLKLDFNEPKAWMLLPIKWISTSFSCFPCFDILTSNNTIPDKFLGNPFYLEALNTLSSITTHEPTSVYDLYSTSIWYNKTLVTKLNLQLKLKD